MKKGAAPSKVSHGHCGSPFASVLLALLVSLLLAAPASAAAPEFLFQTPADNVTAGPAAGQLNNPRGMVADPDTGHLYVADLNNSRISEFTAWGAFVKAWGWDVAPEGAPGDTPSNELEICTTTCQAGVTGSGAGQFQEMSGPFGLAIDANGDIYTQETTFEGAIKNRVQKFSPSGQFILMFGGQVNKTKVAEREAQEANSEPVTVTPQEENLCTAASGDTCGAGVSGAADSYFSAETVGNHLTFNPKTGTLFAGDKDRIQEFGTDGTFKGKIDFEGPGELGAFDGRSVQVLAADPASGDLYFALASLPDVHRLDPDTEALVGARKVSDPRAIAVDAVGNLYVLSATLVESHGVLGFASTGDPIQGMELADKFAAPPNEESIQGLATNVAGPGSDEPGNLYVGYFRAIQASYLNAYGPPPIAFEDPPLAAPEIGDQYAASVDADGALLKAEINPRFWPDATFRVQYATEQCIEAQGWEAPCVSEEPAAPGTLLTAKSVNSFLTTPGVLLAGLEPETAYRYRFVARSSGSGGEDAIGQGGKPGAPGEDSSFTTFPLADPLSTECPNQAFRIGPGAKLPDCRAYEMVSPLEKGDGDIHFLVDSLSGLHQSSTDGGRFTYTSSTAFGDVEAAPIVSQYLGVRDPATGWSSEALSGLRTKLSIESTSDANFKNLFKAFSPDLCDAWLRTFADPPLAAGAVTGTLNLYRRHNCGAQRGSFAALSTVPPPEASPPAYSTLEIQGLSADGARTLYLASDQLTPEALPNPNAKAQLYERDEEGNLRLVCVFPDGSPINPLAEECSAGTGSSDVVGDGQTSNTGNAYSSDGRRVFWTASKVAPSTSRGAGRIYVRIDHDLGLEGDEETIAVSQSTGSNAKAFFWGADENGARAVFEMTEGPLADDLYSFEVGEGEETLIAKGVLGVLGISADANRVYFASKEALAGSGQNSEGDEAESGEPNLYLYEAGEPPTYSFVGVLSGSDTSGGFGAPSPGASSPIARLSRVAADGRHAVFVSTAPLTGYDNTDLETGKAATEVYLYDAESGALRCVSCNRSGARPDSGELLRSNGGSTGIPAAAQIPAWTHSLYASRVLAEDGSRLFFESHEALVLRDTNGVQDVYRWQEAGTGDCDEGDAVFNTEAGGCVDLISSGESPQASYFRDADPKGTDVFFSTLSSLLPQDYGLIDVYDARVGGGFPQPKVTPACEGEACQGPLVAPDDPTPASSSFEGAGNVTESPKPSKCAKGRRAIRKAGKTRCIKKPRKAKRAKRANKTRRAAR